MKELFSVYQFLEGDIQERVREWVPVEEAMKAAQHYTTNVAVRMGITKRVIVIDQLDCTVFEWQRGKGVTFPPLRHKPL